MGSNVIDYLDTLRSYGFTPDDDSELFTSPGGQAIVHIDDGTVRVTAVTPDRARLIRWATELTGAPVELLDAALRAAEPELTRVHNGQNQE